MRRPQLIAHRGASAVAPESTRAAIAAAVRAGADMVELDVQMTRDRRLVIFHDDRLERTTNGRGRLSRTRYAELARLDAGGWFAPRFAGERVLLASQALRQIPRRMGINLELKRTPQRPQLTAGISRLLRRHRLGARLILSSFDDRLLAPFTHRRMAVALICGRRPDQSLRLAIRLGCAAWHPKHTLVTPARIARAHAAGLRVRVWTVDTLPRARQLARWGVDGLFTNDPARLRRAFQRP